MAIFEVGINEGFIADVSVMYRFYWLKCIKEKPLTNRQGFVCGA